MTKQNKSVCF